MKIKLIGNPIAGNNGLAKIRQTAGLLTGMGTDVEVCYTEYAGHAEELAHDCQGFDRLVAVGGDGTVNEVINGMMPNPVPLAVIPLGTANVFALEVDLPGDLGKQCQIAVEGTVQQVTLGRAGERYFLLMAGVGLDAEVVRLVNLNTKRWLGKGAYLLSALRVLSHLPPPVDLQYDDCRISDLAGIIICNSKKYGGNFSLAPRASLFSSTFQVITVPHRSSLGLVYLVLRSLFSGGLAPDIQIFETTNAYDSGRTALNLSGTASLQLDGDPAGMLPDKIISCPRVLPMVFNL